MSSLKYLNESKEKDHMFFFHKLKISEKCRQRKCLNNNSSKEFSIKELLNKSNISNSLSIIKNEKLKSILINCTMNKSISKEDCKIPIDSSKKDILKKSLKPIQSKLKIKKEGINTSTYNIKELNKSITQLPLLKDSKKAVDNSSLTKKSISLWEQRLARTNQNKAHSKILVHNLSSLNLKSGKLKLNNNKSIDKNIEAFEKFKLYKIKNVETLTKNGIELVYDNYEDCIGILTNKKEKINQDRFISIDSLKTKSLGCISLFGIMDGHGHEGHLISEHLKNYLINFFENYSPPKKTNDLNNYNNLIENNTNSTSITNTMTNTSFYFENPSYICKNDNPNFPVILEKAIKSSTDYLKSLNKNYFINSDKSGSTCCLVVSATSKNMNNFYCSNVGDSRAVLFIGKEIIPLSVDHKPSVQKEKERILKMGGEIIQSGKIDRIYFKNYSFPGLALSRSVGDFASEEIGVISKPDIKKMNIDKYKKEAVIILASDGLWDFLSNEDVRDIICKYNKDIKKGKKYSLVDTLYENVVMRWRENKQGRLDDTTIIAVFME